MAPAYKSVIAKAVDKVQDEGGFDNMTPKEKVNAIFKNIEPEQGLIKFAAPILEGGLTLLDAWSDGPGKGRTLWEFDNTRHWSNSLGNLHGGAAATVFDIATSATMMIVAKPGFWMFLGVSRSLNVTYVRPAPADEPVLIECEIIHAGARLAVIKGTIRRKSDGEILTICEHNKVNMDPKL